MARRGSVRDSPTGHRRDGMWDHGPAQGQVLGQGDSFRRMQQPQQRGSPHDNRRPSNNSPTTAATMMGGRTDFPGNMQFYTGMPFNNGAAGYGSTGSENRNMGGLPFVQMQQFPFGMPIQQQQQQQQQQPQQQKQQQVLQSLPQVAPPFGQPVSANVGTGAVIASAHGGEDTALFNQILGELKEQCKEKLAAPSHLQQTLAADAMFRQYLLGLQKRPEDQRRRLPDFRKGLLQEFMERMIANNIFPEGPTAEERLLELCRYMRAQPVGGVLIFSRDLKKVLLTKNTMCPDYYSIPKRPCMEDEQVEAVAERLLRSHTGVAHGSKLRHAPRVEFEFERGAQKQKQTVFLVADVVPTTIRDAEWRPADRMPHLAEAWGQKGEMSPSLETVARTFEKIAPTYQRLVQQLDDGIGLDGPAFAVEKTANHYSYAAIRKAAIDAKARESPDARIGFDDQTLAQISDEVVAKRVQERYTQFRKNLQAALAVNAQ